MCLSAVFRRSLLVILLVGCAHFAFAAISENDRIVADLPVWEGKGYRVEPYLAAAASLQQRGESKAIEILRRAANVSKTEQQEKVIILCRMLFEARSDKEFRRPMLGAPRIIGAGRTDEYAERADSYLTYCVNDCAWSKFQFTPKSDKELDAALKKLVASINWYEEFKDQEIKFLSSQILKPGSKQ